MLLNILRVIQFMRYDHMQLLREMVDHEAEQSKILEFFQKEGYTESEILTEISDYEREKEISKSLKE